MKVIAVYGSGRKDSNCAAIMGRAVQGARDAGHSVSEYWLYEMRVSGCTGCRECKEGGAQKCVLNDDLKPYFDELYQADALLVCAPNHTGLPCGPAITYLNRHYCLLDTDWRVKVRPGIKVVGIFSQGQPDEQTYKAVYESFMADFTRRDMALVDILIHAGRAPAKEDAALMQRAYQLGHAL